MLRVNLLISVLFQSDLKDSLSEFEQMDIMNEIYTLVGLNSPKANSNSFTEKLIQTIHFLSLWMTDLHFPKEITPIFTNEIAYIDDEYIGKLLRSIFKQKGYKFTSHFDKASIVWTTEWTNTFKLLASKHGWIISKLHRSSELTDVVRLKSNLTEYYQSIGNGSIIYLDQRSWDRIKIRKKLELIQLERKSKYEALLPTNFDPT